MALYKFIYTLIQQIHFNKKSFEKPKKEKYMPEKSLLRRSGLLNMIFFEILQNKIKEEKSLLRRSGLV